LITEYLTEKTNITEGEKDYFMAEQTRSVSDSLVIELDNLSAEDKINLIGEIADELTVQQLRVVREIVDQKRLEKLAEAKAQVNEDSPQQATGYQKEDDPEPARSKLRGITPKEIDKKERGVI
jgi:hypothetical protein